MRGKDVPALLVLAPDPAERNRIAAALPDWRVQGVAWSELREPARFVDALGAIVVWTGDEGDDWRQSVDRLRDLPAGRAIVALVGVPDEDGLLPWLQRLRPAHLLPRPPNEAALRWALEDLGLRTRGGRGARDQQRRATALLGVSAAIRGILDRIRQIAPSDVNVLILGETGTGKELVARAVHEQSGRSGSFVAVNCGALPGTLLESELFGYVRGAFTGAEREKRGLFEEADRGTLFLDEVGDTPLEFQVKLLRAIETGEIRPVGATRAKRVDVRIVSATHRDLEAHIADETFRADLYYRLNAFTLHVPPLRRRAVDIPFLAQHFAEELGAQVARDITLSEDFLEALCAHGFPGNVRELRNAVERAVALATPGEPVSTDQLPPDMLHPSRTRAHPGGGTLRERVEALEVEAIREALVRSDGNRTRAAAELGLSRVGLRGKMRRLGMEPRPRRRGGAD